MRKRNKLVEGFGVNDADYETSWLSEGGRKRFCPYYLTWRNMLKRCYNKAYQRSQPTYVKCQVAEEWKYFSAFKKWMEVQDWLNKQLDKDLLGDGVLYSPETCTFISQSLNKLITDFGTEARKLPTGVCYDKSKGKFVAQVGLGSKTSTIMARFDTVEEADWFYRRTKMELILERSREYEGKVREALVRRSYTYVRDGLLTFDQWCADYGVTYE